MSTRKDPLTPFNALTPAQAERLALLLEELGEAQQAIGKILRHGYESYSPSDPSETSNRAALEREMGDVMCALTLLIANGDLNDHNVSDRSQQKAETIRPYLHHN
jgi:NTP pyrophosphatase (non-canonical NTP hydrolase)